MLPAQVCSSIGVRQSQDGKYESAESSQSPSECQHFELLWTIYCLPEQTLYPSQSLIQPTTVLHGGCGQNLARLSSLRRYQRSFLPLALRVSRLRITEPSPLFGAITSAQKGVSFHQGRPLSASRRTLSASPESHTTLQLLRLLQLTGSSQP